LVAKKITHLTTFIDGSCGLGIGRRLAQTMDAIQIEWLLGYPRLLERKAATEKGCKTKGYD
jgi:hypothetical protein